MEILQERGKFGGAVGGMSMVGGAGDGVGEGKMGELLSRGVASFGEGGEVWAVMG